MTCRPANWAQWVSLGHCPSVAISPGSAVFACFFCFCLPLTACQPDERYFLWVTALFCELGSEGHYLKTFRARCCCLLPRRVRPQNSAISVIGHIHLKCTLLCAVLTGWWPSSTHFQRVLWPFRPSMHIYTRRQQTHLNSSHFFFKVKA